MPRSPKPTLPSPNVEATVGGVTLFNVEASIHTSRGLDVALLGMSFLNRTEIRREGATLTLTKRY